MCFTVMFTDEVENPYAERTYTVDSRYLDRLSRITVYLEVKILSVLKENATLVISVTWSKLLGKPFTLTQVLSKSVEN